MIKFAQEKVDKIASHLPDPLLLVMRLYWGWQFFVTGRGKLMHLDETAEFFATLHLPLPKLQALLAGSTECLGGLFLAAGLFSRLVSVPLMFTMIVAYLTAHLDVVKGIFWDPDAFVTEAPFLFLLTSVMVFTFGPGRFSLDGLLRKKSAES